MQQENSQIRSKVREKPTSDIMFDNAIYISHVFSRRGSYANSEGSVHTLAHRSRAILLIYIDVYVRVNNI